MKRAQAHEIGAPLFELHVATDDFNDVGSREQFLNKGLGDGHGAIVETSSDAACAD